MASPVAPSQWVFLVGCYNSGTTLLARLVGAHPEIASLPDEGQYLTHELVKDYDLGVPRMWCEREEFFRWDENHEGPDVQRIRREWAIRLPKEPAIVLEKTPANIARMRWLQTHFAPATFIAIVRNGYAVAEGIRRKAQPSGKDARWPIEQCAHQWRRCAEVLREDGPHIHRLMTVRYEDLTREANALVGRIWRFIGLDDNPAVPSDTAWVVHERREAVRNMNGESLSRLTPAEIDAIERTAGPELRAYGYERPEWVTGD